MNTNYTTWKAMKDAGYPQRDYANFSFSEEIGEDGSPVGHAMIIPLDELMEACSAHFASLVKNKEPFEDGTRWFVNYYQKTGEVDASGKTAEEALCNLWLATRLPINDPFEDIK